MGDLARRRARPWLMAASTALLAVSLLMTVTIVWIISHSGHNTPIGLQPDLVTTLGWIDLAAAVLIALSVVLLGQAIVAYEVFTGKSLPRRGFRRHWRSAVLLAAGYAGLVGWSLTVHLRPVYSLLLTAVLMIAFYALLVWRSFADREQTIQQLRPFVSSQQLYDQLLTGSEQPQPTGDPAAPLRALCSDVLGADRACLVPLGPLATLLAPLWACSPDAAGALDWLNDTLSHIQSPAVISLPLDPLRCSGFNWVVPLWSARGLIGALALGSKRDGGPYTQEEIEVARAAGERIIDTRASAELALRLMALQRHRLAESQLLDQRARCTLHDDILPRLHTTLLTLAATPPDRQSASISDTVASLADVHRQLSELLRNLPAPGAPRLARLGLVGALRQAVEDELADAFSAVTWHVEPVAEEAAHRLPPMVSQVAFYAAREAMRNAARHARRTPADGLPHLSVSVEWCDGLTLCVEDDGIGLTTAAAASAGSGQGLALHSALMAVIGGAVTVESAPGAGTRVLLNLPPEVLGKVPEPDTGAAARR